MSHAGHGGADGWLNFINGLTGLLGGKLVQFDDTGTPTCWLKVNNGGTEVILKALCSSGDANLDLYASGTGTVRIPTTDLDMNAGGIQKLAAIYDNNGNELLTFTTVASAVNYLLLSNSSTGNPLTVSAFGDDTDVSLRIQAKGAGEMLVGESGKTSYVNKFSTSNPTGLGVIEGAQVYRTDLNETFWYDGGRTGWLGPKQPVYFGHSGSALAAGTRLRVAGLSSDSDAVYEMPFDFTIVGYSYARSDSDASEFDIMANASTVLATASTSATRGSDMTLNVTGSAGDELWARVGSGAANSMNPRSFTVYIKQRAT